MWRWILAVAVIASGAEAEVVKTSIPVEVVASGGHCDKVPDDIIAAPDANGGQYEHNLSAFDYVVNGDRFAAQKWLGVGVRVKLTGYGPGQNVTVRVDPPEGKTGTWDMKIGPDGELEFGRLPAIGEALSKGRYLLSVLNDGRYIFAYAITLEATTDDSLCAPEVS